MLKSDIKNVFSVLKEGFSYYFKHFVVLSKYISFPVFGQFLGVVIIAITTTIYAKILPNLIEKYEIFQTPAMAIGMSILVTIPGLAILLRAFWRYIAAYGTISSMTENMSKSGKIYDIAAHDELINRAAPQYILLWLFFGIFTLVGSFPLFWVPAGILFIYLVLIFQVFTLSDDIQDGGNAVNAFRQSFLMVKEHFLVTLLLLVIIGILTYVIFPNIFIYVISKTSFGAELLQLFKIDSAIVLIPQINLNIQQVTDLAINTLISTIIIMFTLPLRAIIWTLWYKKLAPKFYREQRKANKSKVVKLDKRILDRAMEDYE